MLHNADSCGKACNVMPETLAIFIHRRLNELAAEERDLRAALRLIQDEQDQLHHAASAAGVSAVATVVVEPAASTRLTAVGQVVRRSAKRASERTIKEAVVEILRERGEPMTALD